jgi:hypothetical protein
MHPNLSGEGPAVSRQPHPRLRVMTARTTTIIIARAMPTPASWVCWTEQRAAHRCRLVKLCCGFWSAWSLEVGGSGAPVVSFEQGRVGGRRGQSAREACVCPAAPWSLARLLRRPQRRLSSTPSHPISTRTRPAPPSPSPSHPHPHPHRARLNTHGSTHAGTRCRCSRITHPACSRPAACPGQGRRPC